MIFSTSILNSTEFLNNPISNSTQYDVNIIISNTKIKPVKFKLNKTTGKIIIEYSENNKVRFNINDILSLQNEEDLDPFSIHNSKLSIMEKYGQNIFNSKNYVIIHYYPKNNVNTCNLFNLFYNCSFRETKKVRNFEKVKLIMNINDIKELKNEIVQRFGSMMTLSKILNNKNKKFIFFTQNKFNEQNTYFSHIKSIYHKSNIEIEYINDKEISQNNINEINLNEIDGIIICDDNNSFVHKIINFFFQRNDSKLFFEKIPFGFIPSSPNKNLFGGALSKSILSESNEEYCPESAAFITSIGGIKNFDIMEIFFNEQDKRILSLISLQWANNANFYYNLENSSCSCFCCCDLFCSCLQNKGFIAKIEYNSLSNNENNKNSIEGLFNSNDIFDSLIDRNINVHNSNTNIISKIDYKNFSYFLCSNLPYINNAMKATPLSKINDEVFNLIIMDKDSSNGYDLYNQIKNLQYTGDYFFDQNKGEINLNIKLNYEKGNYLQIIPEPNDINSALDYYIDGERYENGKIEINIIPSFIKVFYGIFTEE